MSYSTQLRIEITAKIIDAIENKKLLPWRRSWATGHSSRRHSNLHGRPYSGINPLILEIHGLTHGFGSTTWGTFNQWRQAGASVNKRPAHIKPGAWGVGLVLFRPVKKTRMDKETGEEVEDQYFLMKKFTVFNAEQVTGPEIEKFQCPKIVPQFNADFGPAEELIQATGAKIIHHGPKAFYRRPTPEGSWPHHTDGDYIVLPPKNTFISSGAYYETAFHELAHFSEVRLGWDHSKHGYCMNELVAEISASYLSAELGVPQGESLENHASYLKFWLEGMKADPSFLFKTSTQASKVTDFLLSFVGNEEDKEEGTEEEEAEAVLG